MLLQTNGFILAWVVSTGVDLSVICCISIYLSVSYLFSHFNPTNKSSRHYPNDSFETVQRLSKQKPSKDGPENDAAIAKLVESCSGLAAEFAFFKPVVNMLSNQMKFLPDDPKTSIIAGFEETNKLYQTIGSMIPQVVGSLMGTIIIANLDKTKDQKATAMKLNEFMQKQLKVTIDILPSRVTGLLKAIMQKDNDKDKEKEPKEPKDRKRKTSGSAKAESEAESSS